MISQPTHFADRIVNVSVTGSLIRLDLATLVAPAKDGDKPSLQSSQTLVMPLDGFLASFSMLEAMINKMVAEGMLKPPQSPGPASQP